MWCEIEVVQGAGGINTAYRAVILWIKQVLYIILHITLEILVVYVLQLLFFFFFPSLYWRMMQTLKETLQPFVCV